MNPLLAFSLERTAFGAAPTILGVALAVFWFVVILRRYPVERPLYRFIGIVCLAFSMSMLLGLNQSSGAETGGFGGVLGRMVAEGLVHVHFDGIAYWLLLLAVLGSIPLATEWFFIPFFIRLQSGDRALRPGFAGAGGIGSTSFSAASGGHGSVDSNEEDSTQDPSASASATAVEDAPIDFDSLRAESAAALEAPPQNAYESHSEERVYTMPSDDEVLSREEVARLNEPDPDADTPWYARRKRRREQAEAAARAQELADDSPPITETPRVEETASAAPPMEAAPEVEDVPYYRRTRRNREIQPEAATTDLTSELADAVPSVEAPSETRAEAMETQAADDDGRDAVASNPESQAAIQDDFADFLNSATDSVVDRIAPLAEPEPEPIASEPEAPATSFEREAIAPRPEAARIEPAPAESAPAEAAPSAPIASSGDDADRTLFLAAGDAVVDGGRASISFLQRTLSVGYFQAAKLLDRLEKEGVIGPYTGAVSRKVLIDATDWSAKKHSL